MDRVAKLEERVRLDPYDAAAWEQLLVEVESRRKSPEQVAKLKRIYEDLLSKFPTAVRPPTPRDRRRATKHDMCVRQHAAAAAHTPWHTCLPKHVPKPHAL
jgi:hypothetical protein